MTDAQLKEAEDYCSGRAVNAGLRGYDVSAFGKVCRAVLEVRDDNRVILTLKEIKDFRKRVTPEIIRQLKEEL